MSGRVFVHVGSPKSGTTFLQRVLWSHRELLKTRGLLLPGAAFIDHFRATLDVREVSGAQHDPALRHDAWRHLAEEVAEWEADALISHELFAAASASQAARALEALGDSEVHVVVTARDLLRQVPAEWQEMLKHRSTLTFPAFVHAVRHHEPAARWFWRVQDVADVLERWGHALPRSQVHVVTVPGAGADAHELWRRFTGLIGLDDSGIDLTVGRSNSSVRAEQAELLRLLNVDLGDRLSEPGAYPDVVKSVLAHEVLAGRGGTRFALVGDDRKYVRKRAGQMVTDIRRLDVDVVGELSDLTPTGEMDQDAAAVSADATVSREAVLAESVAALAGILEQLSVERTRRRELRAEFETQRGELMHLREVAAERDRLVHDVRHRPIRRLLIEESKQRPSLWRLRTWYWRLMDAVPERLRRRS